MAASFECQDCIGMREHGCYCAAMGATQPGGPLPELAITGEEIGPWFYDDAAGESHGPFYGPCPNCDGAGEWDEGPLPASSGATEPDYRQVICPECEGTGEALVECEPRTLDDLENEEWDADAAAWFASICALVKGETPISMEHAA